MLNRTAIIIRIICISHNRPCLPGVVLVVPYKATTTVPRDLDRLCQWHRVMARQALCQVVIIKQALMVTR